MLINAVPLICQQRLALALLNPSGYTVNPSCTCRTSYSRAAWCSTLYYSRCTHSHPATRSAARGTPASSAASPAYVRARSSPPVPCTTRVRDPPADAPSRYRLCPLVRGLLLLLRLLHLHLVEHGLNLLLLWLHLDPPLLHRCCPSYASSCPCAERFPHSCYECV